MVGVRSPVGYRVPALYMYRLLHFTRTPAIYSRIFHSRILHVLFGPAFPHNHILPTPRKITFMYNIGLNFVSVSCFTACIIVIFRVKVSVSVRLRCHPANKVSVRYVYWSGE